MLRSTEQIPKRSIQDERGAVLIILSIVFITGLTLIGVALDSGNLFHNSMLLQKAIDAGALAGAKKIAVTGKQLQNNNPALFVEQVKAAVRSMISANMAVRKERSEYGSGNPGDPLVYSIDVNLADDTVSIRAGWTVDLILLRYLPGFRDRSSITLSTKAQVQRSMVSLLLDTSGSMMCPADGSDCSCAETCGGIRKVDRLKQAVALFAVQFNDNRDLLHMSYFSLGAFTALPMIPSGGFFLNQVQDALRNMFLQGATNQCAALLDGWLNTRQAVERQGNRKNVAYVLFSDGAPTAARFSFANPTALPANDVLNLNHSSHDYYNWAVAFRNPADPNPLSERPSMDLIPGPMMLAKSGAVPYDWDQGNPPPGSAPACSQKDPLDADKKAPFVSCMSDFGFYIPWDPSPRVWGAGTSYVDYRKQYYNCVIALADGLRDEGGVVYTVGLGVGAPGGADPYQDVTNDSDRKDYFFTRVANDPDSTGNPAFPGEFATYVPPTRASHLSQGQYLPLSNALSLEEAFLQIYDVIVRKVKTVQLVE